MALRSAIRRLLCAVLLLAAATAGLGLTSWNAPLRLSLRGGTQARPLLAVLPRSSVLVQLHPSTLAPLPRPRLDLGNHHAAVSFSPDRSRLVLSNNSGRLLFVDTHRFKRIGTFETHAIGGLRDTAWFPGRLLALSNPGAQRLIVGLIDPNRRSLLAQRSVSGWVLDRERTPREIVLLLAQEEGIGPASLVVVDQRGVLRRTTLERIVGGSEPDELAEDPGNAVHRYALPGLAVDPASRKAYAVAAGAPLAEIDLETLAVSYHELSEPVSLLGSLRDWLQPKALAKTADGPVRRATWLGNGMLAIFGFDHHGWIDERGKAQMRTTPAGVRIVDVASWSVRTINPDATAAVAADELLLTTGHFYDSTTDKYGGIGLRAYGTDGFQRYHVLGTTSLDVQAVGQRAVVSGSLTGYRVLDLTNGTLVRAASGWAPIVLGSTSSFDP